MSTYPLLRPEEVAKLLAVSKPTVRRLAGSGELASLQVRGQVRFRPEAVDEYLARCEAKSSRPRSVSPKSPVRPLKRGRPRKEWVPSGAA